MNFNLKAKGEPMKKRQTYPKLEHLFYSAAVFMLIALLLNLSNIHQYIHSLVQTKQLVISQQLVKVIIAYFEVTLPYAFYTLTLFGFGFLIAHLKTTAEICHKKQMQNNKTIYSIEENDDEIDAFLLANKKQKLNS